MATHNWETTDAETYKQLLQFARENRKHPTEAENVLWKYLSHNTMGVHFRRQHPVCGYIPDFVCLSLKVIIEIDGGYHFEGEQPEKDAERTQFLEAEGYRVVRFTNEDVLCNTDETLDKIVDALDDAIADLPVSHEAPTHIVSHPIVTPRDHSKSHSVQPSFIQHLKSSPTGEDLGGVATLPSGEGRGGVSGCHSCVRIGMGYDVHRLVEGRKLILGGIEIDHEKGLLGHSDADVLIHAISDALLGAANMRDIGYHFPDTSAETDGMDSKLILKGVVQLIATKGYRVGNIDATVCAERPKLNPHVPAMKACLASVIGCSEDQISIKATTTEKLGFTGREEGMSAYAVCLIESI